MKKIHFIILGIIVIGGEIIIRILTALDIICDGLFVVGIVLILVGLFKKPTAKKINAKENSASSKKPNE